MSEDIKKNAQDVGIELTDEDMDAISAGAGTTPRNWKCNYCYNTIQISSIADCVAHYKSCPKHPCNA